MIENLAAFYRVDTVPTERAWVIVSMITSIDVNMHVCFIYKTIPVIVDLPFRVFAV